MNGSKYLKKLRASLEEEKIDAVEDIVAIYSRRFDLGREAGMDEDEIIEMIGPIDDIVKKYRSAETVEKTEEVESDKEDVETNSTYAYEEAATGEKTGMSEDFVLVINSLLFDSLEIVGGPKEGIHLFSNREDFEIYHNVERSSNKLIISPKWQKYLNRKKFQIRIELGSNCFFSKFEIKNTSSQISICPIYGKTVTVSSISGDIDMEYCEAVDAELNVVSGDIFAKKIKADSFGISSVSGDISLQDVKCTNVKIGGVSGDLDIEVLDSYATSIATISGDVNIAHCSTTAENLKTSKISGSIHIGK